MPVGDTVVAAPSHEGTDHSNEGTFEGSALAKKQHKITNFFGDEWWDEPLRRAGVLRLLCGERRTRTLARDEKKGEKVYLFQTYNRA
jgi:hypothetical protein